MARKAKKEEQPVPSIEPARPVARPWYRNRRTLIIAVAVIGGLIFLQVMLWAGLSYKSVTGEDLTIFLQADKEYMQLSQGENDTVNFTLGVNNLPFCDAVCSWNVSDYEKVVASGTLPVAANKHEHLGYVVEAPELGTGKTVYQVQVSCWNPPAQYCQSSGKARYATAIAVVNVSYSKDKEEQAASIAESLPAWQSSAQQTLSSLNGIANVSDVRARSIAQTAAAEAMQLDERATQVRTALYAEQFGQALELIAQPQPNMSIKAYGGLVEMEQQAAALYASILQQAPLTNALLEMTNDTDHQRLTRAAQTVSALHDSFYQQPISTSASAFKQFDSITSELNVTYTPLAQAQLAQATSLLAEELQMGCTLKNLTCNPLAQLPNGSLEQSTGSIDTRCAELKALPAVFTQMQTDYAKQLDDNLTVAEVEREYGVPEARSEPGFEITAQQLREAARNGTLLTDNNTLRLAVPLELGAETVQFINSSCALRNESLALPQQPLSPSLPAEPKIDSQLPVASLPPAYCCGLDSCGVCTSVARYPVVFVHGHSFTDNTAPEYSLNAFTPFAQKLQQDGYLYAGHVFPQDDLNDVPYAELQQLPEDTTFTVTYYYDSYQEQGKTRFVVRKSENIETYAIRLKEDIDLVKHRTGQDKVVIVAHSMGGLVSRRYIQLFGEDDVAALIMIGTPNSGISNTTQSLCPIFGGDKECGDMYAGSVFISKLNAGKKPGIPVYTFAGTGCSGRAFDGVVEASSVELPFANNTIVQGSCPSRSDLLHSALLDPGQYPEVYESVRKLLDQYTVPSNAVASPTSVKQ